MAVPLRDATDADDLNMRPRTPRFHGVYCVWRYAVLTSKSADSIRRCANSVYVLVRQFCFCALHSTRLDWKSFASFADHVRDIFKLGAQKQVLRIYAQTHRSEEH